ncbi:MAG: hypothetical protein COV67_06060 [Nitrospinae bacterium CG11_big_fil_rev_8_21_14_0_20_56_8]|nr:MAG: hypothetical protein COV67_06060 [Nitrospinae bacterium CG11_big_fil_rev_8_21_14_0_20_56_8]
MRNPVLPLIIALPLVISVYLNPAFGGNLRGEFFNPSRMVSLETSTQELKQIYYHGNHNRTLHCGCFFDKLLQVRLPSCGKGPGRVEAAPRQGIVDWVHGMPASVFGARLACFNRPLCESPGGETLAGARCCQTVSPKFKSMEADMHNLFPGIETAGASAPAADPAQRFGGMAEYGFCNKEGAPPEMPRKEIRGDLARAHFYMSVQYGIPIPQKEEDELRLWHVTDPPDAWEEERNTQIELVQGNRNPFIDHPELAERVRDF